MWLPSNAILRIASVDAGMTSMLRYEHGVCHGAEFGFARPAESMNHGDEAGETPRVACCPEPRSGGDEELRLTNVVWKQHAGSFEPQRAAGNELDQPAQCVEPRH